MNNNIVLLGILVVLINFSFYLKMGKLNRYLLLGGLVLVSVLALVLNKKLEGFQVLTPIKKSPETTPKLIEETRQILKATPTQSTAATTQSTAATNQSTAATTQSTAATNQSTAATTQSTAATNQSTAATTLMALKPEDSKKLSIISGKTLILGIIDTLGMRELSDLINVLRTISENSVNQYSVQQDIGLIVEIIKQLRTTETTRETTDLSETPEYSALRDNLVYVFVDYKSEQYTKMLDIFSSLFNITPIENKLNLINSYTYEVSKRLLEKQKAAELEKRREQYQREIEAGEQEPEREPTVAEKRLDQFLDDQTADKFEELFGKVEPQDMVYNVGVPVEDYMKQIIRPQDWSRALRPPSCIRDSTQLVEPVALLAQGIPSNVHEFRGVGTILPKFAYTETYDPKFY